MSIASFVLGHWARLSVLLSEFYSSQSETPPVLNRCCRQEIFNHWCCTGKQSCRGRGWRIAFPNRNDTVGCFTKAHLTIIWGLEKLQCPFPLFAFSCLWDSSPTAFRGSKQMQQVTNIALNTALGRTVCQALLSISLNRIMVTVKSWPFGLIQTLSN